MPKFTEKQVQNALYNLRDRNSHRLIVPNTEVCYGKTDLVSVSASGLIYDHEIKLSYDDYLADFKNKRTKHFYLKNHFDKSMKHGNYCPNYFYFVTPTGLIAKGTFFPRYAGLMTFTKVNNTLVFNLVRKAPLLHSVKINDTQRKFLERGLMLRYWKLRKSLR